MDNCKIRDLQISTNEDDIHASDNGYGKELHSSDLYISLNNNNGDVYYAYVQNIYKEGTNLVLEGDLQYLFLDESSEPVLYKTDLGNIKTFLDLIGFVEKRYDGDVVLRINSEKEGKLEGLVYLIVGLNEQGDTYTIVGNL